MAVSIDIEKDFKGFSLRVKFNSTCATMGILGASGSGKSITLRCIAGIETPDRGRIVVNGRTIFDSDQKINLVPVAWILKCFTRLWHLSRIVSTMATSAG